MLLNRVEYLLMNNPIRAALQRHYEAPRLLRMGGALPGGHALEIGCGRGVGTELIFDLFGAEKVDAFDLDPRMVAQARRRLASRGDRVRLWVGDASDIGVPDVTYDAVFDFGIIHHVPDWRRVLREVWRVLKPGGTFYAEEVLAGFIHNPLVKVLADHPLADRFDASGFVDGLRAAGFTVIGHEGMGRSFGWFVARRPAEA